MRNVIILKNSISVLIFNSMNYNERPTHPSHSHSQGYSQLKQGTSLIWLKCILQNIIDLQNHHMYASVLNRHTHDGFLYHRNLITTESLSGTRLNSLFIIMSELWANHLVCTCHTLSNRIHVCNLTNHQLIHQSVMFQAGTTSQNFYSLFFHLFRSSILSEPSVVSLAPPL